MPGFATGPPPMPQPMPSSVYVTEPVGVSSRQVPQQQQMQQQVVQQMQAMPPADNQAAVPPGAETPEGMTYISG